MIVSMHVYNLYLFIYLSKYEGPLCSAKMQIFNFAFASAVYQQFCIAGCNAVQKKHCAKLLAS